MQRLRRALGPWAISSHAIALGTQALKDKDWAKRTRQRLDADSQKLDRLVLSQGTPCGRVWSLSFITLVLLKTGKSRWQKRIFGHEFSLIPKRSSDLVCLRSGLGALGHRLGARKRMSLTLATGMILDAASGEPKWLWSRLNILWFMSAA